MTRHITDIERLKKLEKVMERCGVEATAIINDGEVIPDVTIEHAVDIDQNKLPGYLASFIVFNEDEQQYRASWIVNPDYKTYDYAALESVLPVHIFDSIQYHAWALEEKHLKFVYERIALHLASTQEIDSLEEAHQKAVYLLSDASVIYKRMVKQLGSKKLEAMCDLVLLLDENGIELRRCESE